MKLIPKLLAAGVIATAATTAFAADHRDGDGVVMDPAADINDVFAFTNGNNVVLSMTVSPLADKASVKFSDAVQYVFHVTSYDSFGGTKSGSADVICKFTTAQVASCWVGTKDYVTGDASPEAGISSASGKVKLFAGVRADPFYFYLTNDITSTMPASGFAGARAAALNAINTYPGGPAAFLGSQVYASGCLKSTSGASGLVPLLIATQQSQNTFAAANTLAITLEIDKSLLIGNPNDVIAVWASTNNG